MSLLPNWDVFQTRAQAVTESFKEANEQIQGFQNTIAPILALIQPAKANNTEEQISKGEYNEPAGLFVVGSGNAFPIPGIGKVHIIWPMLVAGGLIVYFVFIKKKGRGLRKKG